jgi:DNA-damage-inducible protein D
MGQLLETKVLIKTFDDIKNVSNGIEWRSARDFQKILDYTEWRNFFGVIQKAKDSCKNS